MMTICTHEQSIAIESPQKNLVFIDYLFEDVADKGWSAEQFLKSGTYGSDRFCYAMVASNGVNVYEDSACTKKFRNYIAGRPDGKQARNKEPSGGSCADRIKVDVELAFCIEHDDKRILVG